MIKIHAVDADDIDDAERYCDMMWVSSGSLVTKKPL